MDFDIKFILYRAQISSVYASYRYKSLPVDCLTSGLQLHSLIPCIGPPRITVGAKTTIRTTLNQVIPFGCLYGNPTQPSMPADTVTWYKERVSFDIKCEDIVS